MTGQTDPTQNQDNPGGTPPAGGSLGILNGGGDGAGAGDGQGGDQSGGSGDDTNKGGDQNMQEAVAQAVASAMPAVAAQIEKSLGDRFDAVADRRVNAILKEVRGQNPPAGESGDQGGSAGQGGGQGAGQVVETSFDTRGARQVYREFVADKITLDGAERDLGLSIAEAQILSLFQSGQSDPDIIGKQVAETVATTITSLRDQYETKIVAHLKANNRLVEAPGQQIPTPGAQGAGSGQGGPADPWAAGAEKAKNLYPQRQSAGATG